MRANIAELQMPKLSASVDFADPSLGLQQLHYAGTRVAGHLLGVATRNSNPVSDVFIRGEDLVATNSETDEQPYSLEICWHATSHKQIPILDLILSLETSLLESFPSVSTQSQLSADETWLVPGNETLATQVTGGSAEIPSQEPLCVVLRPAGADWSYAEMSHPADQGTIRINSLADGQIGIDRDLAGAFLEKGVLRRLRLRGALVPRENDLQLAKKLSSELAVEAPPLTT